MFSYLLECWNLKYGIFDKAENTFGVSCTFSKRGREKKYNSNLFQQKMIQVKYTQQRVVHHLEQLLEDSRKYPIEHRKVQHRLQNPMKKNMQEQNLTQKFSYPTLILYPEIYLLGRASIVYKHINMKHQVAGV